MKDIPQHSPGKRLDVVWCFSLYKSSSAYVFQPEIPHLPLATDSDSPFPLEPKRGTPEEAP
jgi:hypothetical protein